MPKTTLKVSVDSLIYHHISSLSEHATMTKSDVTNMILSDFFNRTETATLLQNLLINRELSN